jgi:hypothetical protein
MVAIKAILKLMEKGYTVAQVIGKSSIHLMIKDPKTGLKTIHIRSTSTKDTVMRHDRYKVNIREIVDVDFIMCYIEPTDTWYMIPFSAVKEKSTLSFYPHDKQNCPWANFII